MLSSLIIVFREILEAALIVGILMAATKGVTHRGRFVLLGCVSGIVGAVVVAMFTGAISNAIEGMGQEIFNAAILLMAAFMIGWHVIWMKRHAAELSMDLKKVGREVSEGQEPLYALSTVAFLAVLREGAEIVLFIYGLIASGQNWAEVAGGGLAGLVLGCSLGFLLYLGLVRIPSGSLFSVTGAILIFLAAGMVSQAVGYLSAIGWLPTLADPVWDMSAVLSEKSLLGKILNALIGYTEKPTGIQACFYGLTIGGMVVLLKWVGKTSKAGVLVLIVTAGFIGFNEEAYASKKVYSPHVELGELELEYRGGYVFDDRDDKDGKQKHKFAVGYGVTDFWFTEIYGILENDPGASDDDLEYEATEWENRFQISQPGEWFADTGFMVEWEWAAEDEGRDEVKLVALLEKEMDNWRHRANPFVEYKYGGEEDEDEWEAGASWSTTYRLRKEFEPGFELYWEYGDVDEDHSFDEQELQIGPVVYGKMGDHIKYDIGYLFGVSEDAPDGELKWIMEYEWRF